MLIAEASVESERSRRYLVRLCRHIDKAGRAHPQLWAQVEWSRDRGVVSLDRGRCTLRALPGVLTLRAEAPDEDTLRRLESPSPVAWSGSAGAIACGWPGHRPGPPVSSPSRHPPEATADTRGDAGG